MTTIQCSNNLTVVTYDLLQTYTFVMGVPQTIPDNYAIELLHNQMFSKVG